MPSYEVLSQLQISFAAIINVIIYRCHQCQHTIMYTTKLSSRSGTYRGIPRWITVNLVTSDHSIQEFCRGLWRKLLTGSEFDTSHVYYPHLLFSPFIFFTLHSIWDPSFNSREWHLGTRLFPFRGEEGMGFRAGWMKKSTGIKVSNPIDHRVMRKSCLDMTGMIFFSFFRFFFYKWEWLKRKSHLTVSK